MVGGRREALVRATFQSIAEKGFEGLRLRDVAAGVGIDHSTIHHYFPTKRDLVAAVVEHATRQFWAPPEAEGGPGVRLHDHLAFLASMMAEQPALYAVLRELEARAGRDSELRAVIGRHDEAWRQALIEQLRREDEDGTLTPGLDLAAGADLVIATVKGASLQPERTPAVLDQLERLLTRPGSTGV